MKKEGLNNKVRYVKLRNYPGIRKDTVSKHYQATKTFNGKNYSRTFVGLKEAINWRHTFNPHVSTDVVTCVEEVDKNGVKDYLFQEVWELYKEHRFPCIEKSTIEIKLGRAKFFSDLMNVNIRLITPDFMRNYILRKKKKKSNYQTFDAPLTELKAVFTWYSDEIDYKFINPIKRSHFALGVINKKQPKDKKIPLEDCIRFWANLPLFWRDFAVLQYLTASRVSEIAGCQLKNINLKTRTLIIQEVLVWNKKKKVSYLKLYPKNKTPRVCHISDTMYEIIERRLSEVHKGCNYLFHIKGKPLLYRRIEHEFNKSFKKSNLFDKYSGTHTMRHSMASTARDVTGSIDNVVAMTGHKDLRLAQHYGSLPSRLQKETVQAVEKSIFDVKKSM